VPSRKVTYDAKESSAMTTGTGDYPSRWTGQLNRIGFHVVARVEEYRRTLEQSPHEPSLERTLFVAGNWSDRL
jgi:hypothetical protein